MPAQASFDVTSTIDFQEVDNALNQARKEVAQRYDFKGAKADITLNATEKTLTLVADDEFKMNALWEIVQTRLVRRGVPIKNFKSPPSEPAVEGRTAGCDARAPRTGLRHRAAVRQLSLAGLFLLLLFPLHGAGFAVKIEDQLRQPVRLAALWDLHVVPQLFLRDRAQLVFQ